MSSLTLRIPKGSPLTNAEVDANFTNLLVAIGGSNTTPWTLPTPTGTGSPVLSNGPTITGHPTIEGVTSTGATGTGNLVFSAAPTITGNAALTGGALIGPATAANTTRFPNALSVVSNTAVGIQQNETHNIGIVAEGTAHVSDTAIYGIGVYGAGYTNAATRSGGVVGEGHVSASADTGSAIGVRGYANDTHAGGSNIGLYGDAANGLSNYSLYLNNGDIYSTGAKSWALNGNLTFTGAYSVEAVDFNSTSDISLKENVKSIDNGIELINKLNPVSFTWKENGQPAYGFIAQEVEQVLPELVSKNSEGIKSVKYLHMIALLMEAVKSQNSVIESMEQRIRQLEQ
jgi:hypothetical protein